MAHTFYDYNADNATIADAGNKIIKYLYCNKNQDMSLNLLRYLLSKK